MTSIKLVGRLFAGACIAAQAIIAAPLEKSNVAKDAKWLAHIDMEQVMKASLSGMAIGHLKEEIARNNQGSVTVDIDQLLAEIHSVTAYGETLGVESGEIDGVLLVETGERLQTIFDGFIAHQELQEDSEINFKRVEDRPFASYVLDEELYFAFPNKKLLIASKQYEQIEAAYQVVQGKSASLENDPSGLLLNEEEGFFLIATATGLDGLKNMPPQARILQKTKGGQLSIGEDKEDFRANLVLSTSGPEVSTQLYRIVQGMLALASFAQVENEGLMDVVNRVQVEQGRSWVSIDFRYPVEKVRDLLSDIIQEKGGKAHGAGRPTEAQEGHQQAAPQEKAQPRSSSAPAKSNQETRIAPTQELARSAIECCQECSARGS
ncbi:hypothetical protein [Pelagicoccus sp. SDUM812003]|uniref:hypothetical protein n=1 Tax=Pelagicoccus sp. SDUM812003 TaxID=3041267 RepID=UPI00280F801C|nr:hypothetical protein [Pelagicoccus sp. SDUM812003]MDQ8203091.1 hypothetical protein [Pelagicoccus sp. SDUM812003]